MNRPRPRAARRIGFEALENRCVPTASAVEPDWAAVPERWHKHLLDAFAAGRARAESAAAVSFQTPPPITPDFDGDGLADSASVERLLDVGGDVLRLFHANADPALSAESRVNLGFTASSLLAAQLDGTGGLDLFVSGATDADAAVVLSRSDGTFSVFRKPPPRFDIAVGQSGSRIVHSRLAWGETVLGSPEVVWSLPADAPPMLGPTDLELYDLDGDGLDDLVVADAGTNSVKVYPGSPEGGFAAEVAGGDGLPTGVHPTSVAVARLGDGPGDGPTIGDAHADLVVTCAGSDDVRIYYGQGAGAFTPGPIIPVPGGPSSVLVFDVTADGVPDLVITSRATGRVYITPGVAGGGFDLVEMRTFAVPRLPLPAFVGDIDGDDKLDLVAMGAESGEVGWYSDVATADPDYQVAATGTYRPVSAMLRDVNADGADDLVVAHQGESGDGKLSLLAGGPDGPRLAQTIDANGVQAAAVAAVPGADSYSFYVLDEVTSSLLLMRFTSPADGPGDPVPVPVPSPEGPPAPPDPDSPQSPPPETVRPELRGGLGGRLALAPAYLAQAQADTEADESRVTSTAFLPQNTPSRRQGIAKANPADEAELPDAPLAPQAAPTAELELARFLLGTDDIPAPAVEPDGSTAPVAAERLPAPRAVPPEVVAASEPAAVRLDPEAETAETPVAGPPPETGYDWSALVGAAAVGWLLPQLSDEPRRVPGHDSPRRPAGVS